MKALFFIICLAFLVPEFALSQIEVPLANNNALTSINVKTSEEIYLARQSLKVINTGVDSEATFVKIGNLNFKNGSIKIEVAGKPGTGSSQTARGFVGIAFRINDDNSKFECFYLRPTNGRADDQVRRNHSVQYISFPDFPWHKLRKDFPEKYESYVDLAPGEWTAVTIEVQGEKAKLYVHGNDQPTLIVNDLKLGGNVRGSIGLWIGPGTEAHFANLQVSKSE
ncbi:MAG: hypothetical protein WC384_13725 [Prolixibacteraceae bacterium]|jgi:hypothetical protein